MALAFAPACNAAYPTGRSGHHPATILPEPVPRVVEVGELITLPVLTAPDGAPLDLDLLAAGRPVILLIVPDAPRFRNDGSERLFASARSLAAERAIPLFVVVPGWSAVLGLVDATVAIDAGLRFVHMLGLVNTNRCRAAAGAVIAVNEVGCVTEVEVEPAAS